MSHTHYRDCLFSKKTTIMNMTQIRSDKHQLFSVNMNKIGLRTYDVKKYTLGDL